MLAVTERRLLWLYDDAPVGRVRWLAFRDVATVSLRVRRRGATLSLRTIGGRRHSFADLRPPTAAAIERQLREASLARLVLSLVKRAGVCPMTVAIDLSPRNRDPDAKCLSFPI